MILFSLYFLFVILALWQLRIIIKSVHKYQLTFLRYFQSYLIFFFIYGFIKYVGYLFMIEFFSDRIDESVLAKQLAILIFPFFSIALYFMLLWIWNLSEKGTPKSLRILYWSLQSFIFFYMLGNNIVSANSSTVDYEPSWLPVHFAEVLILFLVVLQIFILARNIEPNIKKRFIKSLGLILVLSFAAYEAYQNLSASLFTSHPRYYFAILGGLYFCVNIPAILSICRFLYRHHQELIDLQFSKDVMSQFCKTYHITPREQEIIEMIISGKSNQEIGAQLFISLQTVKNINYNIYKKVNINNRIQLINLIQRFKEQFPSSGP